MIVIDDTLVSEELGKIYFSCDLHNCHGDCCVEMPERRQLTQVYCEFLLSAAQRDYIPFLK